MPIGRVCNISGCPFSDVSALQDCVVNGLRMASEATTPYLALKYRKIGKRGFPRIFRPENRKHRTSLPQSTEVLHQKYGGLCPRSPMFSSRYSAFFMFFSAFFFIFCRNIRSVLLMLIFIYIVKLIALDGKTHKIRP